MGRTYAGILGSLSMTLVIVRGLWNQGGTQTTLLVASVTMAVMATVGYVLGELAAWTIEESVRNQVAAEITAAEAGKK